ncbi:unnamed protein product [Fusarium graminearum]|nr:unnamed protein product [Fusarium graminearum]CAG1982312.1 unnamed protein product [Fusarium graminearum]VTO90170.1 unnamed protein product [Fusarium graminearum]
MTCLGNIKQHHSQYIVDYQFQVDQTPLGMALGVWNLFDKLAESYYGCTDPDALVYYYINYHTDFLECYCY